VCDSLKGKLLHATKENIELNQEVTYWTSHLERTVMSKMIKDELSRVEKSATKFTYKLGVDFKRCEDKGVKSAHKFIPSSNYHQEEKTIKSVKTHYPSSPKPSFNPKREVSKDIPSRKRKLLCVCFVGVLVTWKSFASVARELRSYVLTMLETHIMMSSLIFHIALSLALHLTLLLMLCLVSLMDLTIAHMVLVHERTALCLNALVTTYVLIVVIIFCVGLVSLLEDLTLTFSRDT
jgi:hypothetical protein